MELAQVALNCHMFLLRVRLSRVKTNYKCLGHPPRKYSLVGMKGYRVPPGNILFISVTRSEKNT